MTNNITQCWLCGEPFKYEGDKYQDVKCPYCKVENSIYKGEDDMSPVPKVYETDFLDYDSDVKVGDKVTVKGVFENKAPKFKSFLVGDVELANGEIRLLSLNKTSYKTIATVLGKNTDKWVGSFIKYAGKKKMGAMEGNLWEAE